MPISEKKLIDHLNKEVYCKLGVSPVHGIGVFAVRDIPKGIHPLRSYLNVKEVDIEKKLIKDLPKGVRQQSIPFASTTRKLYLYLRSGSIHSIWRSISTTPKNRT